MTKRPAMLEMPTPKMIATNGVTLRVYETGPEDGLPVVLAHGWPELAFSWRHQIKALAATGHRVIVPDQRGFGPSSAPEPVEAYDILALTGDHVGLLDALGIEKAVFIGHDWGGIVVWQMPLLHPERVLGVGSLNTPFQPRGNHDPIDTFRHFFGEDFYIVYFQKPGEAEALFEKDVARTFRFFLRTSDRTAAEFARLPRERRSLALQKAFAAPEESWGGTPFLAPEEVAVFVAAYERSGFRGGINWYRNFSRNWRLTKDVPQRIEHPALMVTAGRDVVLSPALSEGMEAHIPNLARGHIEDSGHWTQQERPDEVNRILVDWLRTTF